MSNKKGAENSNATDAENVETLNWISAQGIAVESPQQSEDLKRIARPAGMRPNKQNSPSLSYGG